MHRLLCGHLVIKNYGKHFCLQKFVYVKGIEEGVLFLGTVALSLLDFTFIREGPSLPSIH